MEKLFQFSLIFLWIIVIINLILLVSIVKKINKINRIKSEGNLQFLERGTKVTNFIGWTLDGEEFELFNKANEKVLGLIFISTNCKVCKEKIPEIENIRNTIYDSNPKFYYVCGEEKEDLIAFFEPYKVNHSHIIHDKNKNLFYDFGIQVTPIFYFINKSGFVIERGLMDLSWSNIFDKWVKEYAE